MLQINELDYDRHLHALYLEFLEAIARVCDEASIVMEQDDEEDDEYMTQEERK